MTDTGLLKKVKGLLEKASRTTNEHEAEAFYAKADELMRKNAIDEFMLEALDSSVKGRVPEVRDIHLHMVDHDWEFNDNLYRLFQALARHVGVKIAPATKWNGNGTVKCVGWSQDIDFLDILFTQLHVDILAHMKPRWNPELAEGANIHSFKTVGYKWIDIWYERCKALGSNEPWERKHGVRWTSVYKKWAEANGIDRQISSSLQYFRADFGYGYCQEIESRLKRIRDAREETTEDVGLVLVGKENDLDDFYNEMFPPPEKRPVDPNAPQPKPVKYKSRFVNGGAYSAGRKQGSRADLGQTRIGN